MDSSAFALQPEHGGRCLSDDGVGRARRMDPIPEQVFIRSLAEERLIGGRHARLASVRQPVALRIRNDVVQQLVGIESGDAEPGSADSCVRTPLRPALNICDRPVASCAAPGLTRSSMRIAGVSPRFGGSQTRKCRAPAWYNTWMWFAIDAMDFCRTTCAAAGPPV